LFCICEKRREKQREKERGKKGRKKKRERERENLTKRNNEKLDNAGKEY